MTFLDVGAHNGQTLEEVIFWPFKKIYAFEPMPAQFENLLSRDWPRQVQLMPFGLAGETGSLPLYGNNDGMESSLYPDKLDVDPSTVTICEFVSASEFFATIDGPVVMKLNCEGAEVVILENLVESGEIWKVANVMIDFDVRKIPSMSRREKETLALLQGIGFDRISLCPEVMIGDTHQDRIGAWLRTIDKILEPHLKDGE